MTTLKKYNSTTSQWEVITVGAKGAPGIQNGTVAPTDTTTLWMDTADTASQVAVPAGGVAGQVLAKNSATDFATSWVDQPVVAGKNLVINGAFDFWQRGTSFSNPSNSGSSFTADRWQYVRDANQAGISISRQDAGLPGFQYCARLQRIAGDTGTNNFRFGTALETVNSIPLRGKQITISFYARAGANLSGGISIDVYSGTGTDQGTVWGEFTGNYNVAYLANQVVSSTWTRYTATGTVPVNATQLGVRLWRVGISGTAGVDDYVEVTGFQLEQNSAATTFSRAGGDIQGELAKCQRYYQKLTAPGGYLAVASGFASSGGLYMTRVLPVTMRVAPISIGYSGLSLYNQAGNSYVGLSSIFIDGGTNTQNEVGLNIAGGQSSGTFYRLQANSNTSAHFEINAEIY